MRPLREILRKLPGYLRRQWTWLRQRSRILERLQEPPIVPPADPGRPVILFFSPEAGVGPSFVAQCLLARTLQEQGHRVLFTRCFHLFQRCPVMTMRRLPFIAGEGPRRRICEPCAGNAIDMLEAYGLPHVDLRAISTPEMTTRIEKALERAGPELMNFEYEGIAFGRLAAHDLSLARKLSSFENLPEPFQVAWREYIATAMMAYHLVDAVCSRYPVHRMVHFTYYGLLAAGRFAAERRGIACTNVSLYFDNRRYMILPSIWPSYIPKQAEAWPQWRELSVAPEVISEVAEDVLWHLGSQGHAVYSPPKSFRGDDVRTRLGLAPDRKLLVAYTSSLDEWVSFKLCREVVRNPVQMRPQPFADQIEWLKALTGHVEGRSDVQLVVRIHPREGVTSRDRVASQHLKWLRKALDRPFRNCRIVWPQDPMSSYDLGECADLVLVSWSSIGLEFARMGVPVLASNVDPNLTCFPSDDFIEWSETPEGYFRKLHGLLDRPASLEMVLRAFRFYHLYFLGNTLDLGDVLPGRQVLTLPPFRRTKEASTLEELIVGRRDILDVQHQRLKAAQSATQSVSEREALTRCLRRILHFLLSGVDDRNDSGLTVLHHPAPDPVPRTEPGRILITDGRQVEYRFN
ncbi:MAG TPA: hypothetical protein VEN81_00150, partial [Planctomycetota bacterium]|nr:hypothetical protein [Planctomycetota bacterium]